MIKKVYQNIELCIITLLLITDLTSKIIVAYTNWDLKYYPSTIFKAFLISLVLLFFLKIKDKKKWRFSTVLVILFLLGLAFDPERELSYTYLYGKLYYFIKHLYLFLLVPVLRLIPKGKWESIAQFLILFGKINALFIILGWFFNIEMFKSYNHSHRFGFNGLLPIQGTGTFYYILVICIGLLQSIYSI